VIKHLSEVKESYGVHLVYAVRLGIGLLFLSFVCLIHAIFPFILTDVVSKQIADLNERLQKR
jgi:hypothetical protein